MSDPVCGRCDMMLSGSLAWRCFVRSHRPQDRHLQSLPCYLRSLQFLFDANLFHILQELHLEICFLWWKSLMKYWLQSQQSCCSLLVHIHLCNPEISWVQASLDCAVRLASSARRPDGSCKISVSRFIDVLVVKHYLTLTCLQVLAMVTYMYVSMNDLSNCTNSATLGPVTAWSRQFNLHLS